MQNFNSLSQFQSGRGWGSEQTPKSNESHPKKNFFGGLRGNAMRLKIQISQEEIYNPYCICTSIFNFLSLNWSAKLIFWIWETSFGVILIDLKINISWTFNPHHLFHLNMTKFCYKIISTHINQILLHFQKNWLIFNYFCQNRVKWIIFCLGKKK